MLHTYMKTLPAAVRWPEGTIWDWVSFHMKSCEEMRSVENRFTWDSQLYVSVWCKITIHKNMLQYMFALVSSPLYTQHLNSPVIIEHLTSGLSVFAFMWLSLGSDWTASGLLNTETRSLLCLQSYLRISSTPPGVNRCRSQLWTPGRAHLAGVSSLNAPLFCRLRGNCSPHPEILLRRAAVRYGRSLKVHGQWLIGVKCVCDAALCSSLDCISVTVIWQRWMALRVCLWRSAYVFGEGWSYVMSHWMWCLGKQEISVNEQPKLVCHSELKI